MSRKLAATFIAPLAAALLVYFSPNHATFPPVLNEASAEPLPPINQASQGKNFVCPMHPEIVQDHPGTCPICGMKLVPSASADAHDHGIQVDNTTVQRLGIRLAAVKKATIGHAVQTYGNVVADESAVYAVQSRYEGWVKKLYVHAVGEHVKAGQVLYEIYSPELITRQRTYLSSMERRKQLLQTIQTTPDTESDYVMEMAMDAANDRLRLHQEEGLSIESIKRIEDTKQASDVVQIVAANPGVVTQINVREGSLVMASTVMMTLADTSRVWIDATLYPEQIGQVQAGDAVSARVAGMPAINGRIGFISPLAEGNKVHARISLDNRQHRLRPGMFADLSIRAATHEALVMPRSAVIYSAQGNRVMLSRGDGHFLPVPVETGAEEGDLVELVSGLREGSEVAVNGQFLLDSASSLNAAAERMRMKQP